jgi:outer membrane protein OmpA-like peptidoglycan-associated protein
MPSPIVFPPTPAADFDNVFVFPPERIVDPLKNVLLVANLWNFAINNAELLPDHEAWLGKVAAKLMIGNSLAGARMIGLASRSGSDAYNLKLGLRRAHSAQTTLSLFLFANDLVHPPGLTPRITIGSQGEHFAAAVGEADGTEDARFRSVLVTILADRTKPTIVRLVKDY